MPQEMDQLLAALDQRTNLTRQQMQTAVAWLLTGEAEPEQIRQFLVALHRKGETIDELAGAAAALRGSMIPIIAKNRPVVDTCGTGGDGTKTFNISTAAALALAAAGVRVAKHGNRKITSNTGSADVLTELGINVEASPEVVQKCLDEVGICFCFAPLFHPAMRHVGPVRKSLAHPTIFNRLGPLSNPALADCQVLGVGDQQLVDSMAGALQRLGTKHSLVVRGEDGVDEISLTAPTRVLEVTPEGVEERIWSPEDFGVEASSRDALFADDPTESAQCIRSCFAGEAGPQRDVVVLNAAAGLWTAGVESDLRKCADRIREAIDSGAAQRLVDQLASVTNA